MLRSEINEFLPYYQVMPNVASRKGPVTLIITGKRLKNKKNSYICMIALKLNTDEKTIRHFPDAGVPVFLCPREEEIH